MDNNKSQPAQEPWPDLTKRDRESYRKGHDAGVAHHKQAVKAALAQPVQEPVGYVYSEAGVKHGAIQRDLPNGTPLYTTPPQRPWVEPRGDEWFNWWRVSKIADETEAEIDFADFITIALAVSAKLKEKNNG